jgi:hypothetical protein
LTQQPLEQLERGRDREREKAVNKRIYAKTSYKQKIQRENKNKSDVVYL